MCIVTDFQFIVYKRLNKGKESENSYQELKRSSVLSFPRGLKDLIVLIKRSLDESTREHEHTVF